MAGYGETSYSGPISSRIKAVTLNVITNEQCNENYPYQVTKNQICTLTRDKDTCTVSVKTEFYRIERIILID